MPRMEQNLDRLSTSTSGGINTRLRRAASHVACVEDPNKGVERLAIPIGGHPSCSPGHYAQYDVLHEVDPEETSTQVTPVCEVDELARDPDLLDPSFRGKLYRDWEQEPKHVHMHVTVDGSHRPSADRLHHVDLGSPLLLDLTQQLATLGARPAQPGCEQRAECMPEGPVRTHEH